MPSIKFCSSSSFGTITTTLSYIELALAPAPASLRRRNVIKLAGTVHVNPVLSVLVDVAVRQSGRGKLQYKNHQRHNFLLLRSLLDISRPEW